METRSNRLLVAIVTGVLVAGLLAFAWYISAGTQAYDARYRIAFNESVSGLSVGAPVSMSGVQIGRVTDISLSPEGSGRPIVTVAIKSNLPIRSGFRADISRSLLDGSAALVLLPSPMGTLINPADDDAVGQIAAVEGSAESDPAGQAVEISESLDKAVKSLDANGRRRIEGSLSSGVRTTAGWQRSVDRLLGSVPRDQIRGAGRTLGEVGNGAERLTRTVDTSRDDIANVRRQIRDAGAEIDKVGGSVEAQRPAARNLAKKADSLERDIAGMRKTVGEVSETTKKVLPDDQ